MKRYIMILVKYDDEDAFKNSEMIRREVNDLEYSELKMFYGEGVP
jgi:hypothetical protein